MDYIKILISICIAVIGWIVAHYFTSRRDTANKRRELRTKYLIEAYEVLTCQVSNRPISKENVRLLEDVVAKVQLVGTDYQIQLVKKLCDHCCNKGTKGFPLDELTNALRKDLRMSLGLPDVTTDVYWLRYGQ